MLAEFVSRLVELADAARRPNALNLPGEPGHVAWLANPKTGVMERHRLEPAAREHEAGNLDSLLAYATQEQPDGPWRPVVWYSRQEVVLVLDDGDRRDRMALPLRLTPQFKRLQLLDGGALQWHAQKEFLALLRIALAGCLGSAGNLLGAVRQLKFRQLAEAQGTVQHGKASLGKSIEAQLEGAVNLPEEVVLTVPVFANQPLPPQPVACALDIDPHLEKLALVPLPGALEAALQNAEAWVGSRLAEGLAEAAVPLYYGQV